MNALDDKNLGTVVANIVGAVPHNDVLGKFVHQTQMARRKVVLEKIIEQGIKGGLISPDRKFGPILDMSLGAIYFRLLISGEAVDNDFVDAIVAEVFRK